jgi:hypothetical protein
MALPFKRNAVAVSFLNRSDALWESSRWAAGSSIRISVYRHVRYACEGVD